MIMNEIGSKPRSAWGASVVGLFAFIALMSWAIRARAGCSMPLGLSAAGPAQSGITVNQPRQESLQAIPLGENESIIGLWQITTTYPDGSVDHVISGWTRDGLEFDQDVAPILTGYVCYGSYIKIGKRTYGLTHPFFNFQDINSNGEGTEETEGQWDGTSGLFNYTVTVSTDGTSFSGSENAKLVEGPNPYDPHAKVLSTATATISATKVSIDTSQLP